MGISGVGARTRTNSLAINNNNISSSPGGAVTSQDSQRRSALAHVLHMASHGAVVYSWGSSMISNNGLGWGEISGNGGILGAMPLTQRSWGEEDVVIAGGHAMSAFATDSAVYVVGCSTVEIMTTISFVAGFEVVN